MIDSRYTCSLVMPTRNRCGVLAETLTRLAALPDRGFEVVVVDNGSTDDTVAVVRCYPGVRLIQLGENRAAAARNLGAEAARGNLLLMLDDDSWPEPGTIARAMALFTQRLDLGAAACRVRLVDPPHRHDAGGVPGLIFNCGGFVRREAFLEVGGYPADYEYYAEEYVLCCRLWQRGWRVEPRGDLPVWHRRVTVNRDNNNMLRLLVRNNIRLWRGYAPERLREDMVASTLERYRRVAIKEKALAGFEAGLEAARAEIADRTPAVNPLTVEQFENLYGLPTARTVAQTWADNHNIKKVAVCTRGKGAEQLLWALGDVNIAVVAIVDAARDEDQWWRGVPLISTDNFERDSVDGLVAGTLSPGVAEDLRDELSARFQGLPVLSAAPWVGASAACCVAVG